MPVVVAQHSQNRRSDRLLLHFVAQQGNEIITKTTQNKTKSGDNIASTRAPRLPFSFSVYCFVFSFMLPSCVIRKIYCSDCTRHVLLISLYLVFSAFCFLLFRSYMHIPAANLLPSIKYQNTIFCSCSNDQLFWLVYKRGTCLPLFPQSCCNVMYCTYCPHFHFPLLPVLCIRFVRLPSPLTMFSIIDAFKSLDLSYKKHKAKKNIEKLTRAVVGTTSIIDLQNDKKKLQSLGTLLTDNTISGKFPELNPQTEYYNSAIDPLPTYLQYTLLPIKTINTKEVVFFPSEDYLHEDFTDQPTTVNDLKGRLIACQVYNKPKSIDVLYPIKNININSENLRLIMLMDYSFDLSKMKSNSRVSYRYTNFYRNYPDIKDREFTIKINEVEYQKKFDRELPVTESNNRSPNWKTAEKPKSILKSKLNNNLEKEKYLAAKCDEISTADFIRLVDLLLSARDKTSKSERIFRKTERQHKKILVKRKKYARDKNVVLPSIAV